MSLKRVVKDCVREWAGTVKVSGVARNLATDQIYFTAKDVFSATDGAALFQHTITGGITITNTTGGQFTYGVLMGDTDTCPNARTVYFYDLCIIYATGERYTLDSGTLEVLPSVTSATS